MALYCDAVFEGGGVKGIGFAGAIKALEQNGYEFKNVAGTSAGAIAAALIAVGYSGSEIADELGSLNYNRFRERKGLSAFGVAGSVVNLCTRFGIYRSSEFENWLDALLAKKGKTVFGDIKTGYKEEKYMYKLQVIASDVTDKEMLVFPNCLKSFGIDPDSFSISKAVRMSMSIPLYYEPVQLLDNNGRKHFIVDGGLLSNYPIWLLDDGTSAPPWPTFGLKFTSGQLKRNKARAFQRNIIGFGRDIISTMLEAQDNYHISHSKGDYERSILISTHLKTKGGGKNISTTDFDITSQEGKGLLENGYFAAQEFLKTWDFKLWKKKYRWNR